LREARHELQYHLDLSPDFQRAHVWTREQQIAYVEYCLMGGEVGKVITLNSPDWLQERGETQPVMELVDGKQRIEAVLAFLRDEISIFGHKRSEIKGEMRGHKAGFKFRICALTTRQEILQLYLNINAGGTPHTREEIQKVRDMLSKTQGG
jgi:hypothetical protein